MMKRRQGVSQEPPSPSIFSHVLARPDHSWEFNPHHHFYWESGFGFHSIKAIIIRFHQRSWPTSIMDTINVLKLGNSKPPCSRVCFAANSFWQWLKIISCPYPHQTFLETLFKSKNMSASPQMQTSSKNGALNRIPGLLSQFSRLSPEITQIACTLSFSE